MSRLTVGSVEGLSENSNVVSVPTGHTLNVADAGALQIGGSGVVSAGLVFLQNITTLATTLNIDNCFSSAYTSYRLVMSWLHAASGQTFFFNFRSGGVSDTSAVHQYNYIIQSGTTVSGSSATAMTNMVFARAGTVMNNLSMDIHNPYTVSRTSTSALNFADSGSTVPQQWIITTGTTSDTSYDGISISTGGYTPTYMNLSLYGYRES